jgi:murein L,D-transpeptidase YafK
VAPLKLINLFGAFLLLYTGYAMAVVNVPSSARSLEVAERVNSRLELALKEKNLKLGAPVLMRIFKETSELEVWLQMGKQFKLFKTYKICYFSGKLGPKTKEGDLQSPEGFYSVTPKQLNPDSRFHLAFNLGYPNTYDRAYQRTGNALMVHGNCVSIGCYAMTDQQIEEIYTIAAAALKAGQSSFQVQALPFQLTEHNLAIHQDSQWLDFWRNLKVGYDAFEQSKIPPKVTVKNKQYAFE